MSEKEIEALRAKYPVAKDQESAINDLVNSASDRIRIKLYEAYSKPRERNERTITVLCDVATQDK